MGDPLARIIGVYTMQDMTNTTTGSRAAELVATAAAELATMSSDRMVSSAALCLEDARSRFAVADYDAAAKRALDSLRYSVGIFHPVFRG